MQPAAIIDEVVFHFWKARLGRSLRSFPLATTAHNIRIHIGVNKITVEVPGSHKWRSWLLFRVLSTAETVVNWALVSGPPMSRAEVPWHRAGSLNPHCTYQSIYIYIYYSSVRQFGKYLYNMRDPGLWCRSSERRRRKVACQLAPEWEGGRRGSFTQSRCREILVAMEIICRHSSATLQRAIYLMSSEFSRHI